MSIEFFLELLVVAGLLVSGAWVYCLIFDFVDWWKKKQDRDRKSYDAYYKALTEPRLPPMAPPRRYGMDHEKPKGPPDGWEKRPSTPRAARMMD